VFRDDVRSLEIVSASRKRRAAFPVEVGSAGAGRN
jgi:hypothetical protein